MYIDGLKLTCKCILKEFSIVHVSEIIPLYCTLYFVHVYCMIYMYSAHTIPISVFTVDKLTVAFLFHSSQDPDPPLGARSTVH